MGRESQNFYQWQIEKICYCTSSPSSSPNNHLNPIHNGSIIKSSKRDLIYKLIFNNSWDISVKISHLMSGYLILRWSKSRKAFIKQIFTFCWCTCLPRDLNVTENILKFYSYLLRKWGGKEKRLAGNYFFEPFEVLRKVFGIIVFVSWKIMSAKATLPDCCIIADEEIVEKVAGQCKSNDNLEK